MHSIKVDGQDVEAVHRAAGRALKYARDGKGPVFLLANTYRLVGHYVGDPQIYRDKERVPRGRRDAGPDPEAAREAPGSRTRSTRRSTARRTSSSEAAVEFAKNGTDPKPEDAL